MWWVGTGIGFKLAQTGTKNWPFANQMILYSFQNPRRPFDFMDVDINQNAVDCENQVFSNSVLVLNQSKFSDCRGST